MASIDKTERLTHAKGGVAVGDILPKKGGLTEPSLGVFDHLHELNNWSMRPHIIQKSEKRRIIAVCTNPACSFRFHAKGLDNGYQVIKLSPHTCAVEDIIIPRKKRTKIDHLPSSVASIIISSVAVKCSGRSGDCAKSVQSACRSKTGVAISLDQINRSTC